MRRWFFALLMTGMCVSGLWAQGSSDLSKALKEGAEFEKANKVDEALVVYKKALEAGPNEDLYRKIGSIYGKKQQYDEAENILKESLEKFPESTSLMNLSGFIQLKKGNAAVAIEVWKKVLGKDPKNSFANEWLGKTAKTSGSEVPAAVAASDDGTPATTPSSEGGMLGLKGESSLPLDEQEKIAKQMWQDMAQMDTQEYTAIESCLLTVVNKAPKTKRAEEALWKLHNLYARFKDEPEFDKVTEVLEFLIKKYPDSEFAPQAKKTLLWAYGKTTNNAKLVELYGDLFQRRDAFSPEEFRAYGIEYADALAAVGKKAEAKALYEEIIQKAGNDPDCLEAQLAQEHLGAL
jgi:tetratricopeptide (TPR) repeat protein